MTYSLFIDDERFPARDLDHAGKPWVIARSLDEVRAVIAKRGPPDFISFDHDLGDQSPSGLDIAKAMVAADMISRAGSLDDEWDILAVGFDEVGFRLPETFSFTIHSMNSVGGPNIKALLQSYLASLARTR